MAQVKFQAPPGTSLKSLVRGYVLTHQTEGRSPNTVAYYRGILNRFLWYAGRESWPDDPRLITEWNIRDFLGYIRSEVNRWGIAGNGSESSSRKAAPRTVHHYYRALHAFFNWVVREGFLNETPMARVKVAKPRPRVIEPYSAEQIKKMLKVRDSDYQHNAKFSGSRNRAIIFMLADTGLRVSELASIRFQDIDTDRGWIKVMGKGAKERVVRIGPAAQKALWRYLMHRPENSRQEIWLTEEGKPLRSAGIQSMIDRVKERAGVAKEGCVHRFRHTFALNFFKADRNARSLQYLLGHSSLEMVMRYADTLGMEDALEAHVKASPADLLNLK